MVDIILPIIDADRCTGCGTCVELCLTHAVELRRGRAHIARPDDCNYCGDCEDICPEGAIALPYEIVLAEPVEQAC
jgi:NAD-dependent dihydropyrimidine dehydrogenase PreA subunit